MSDTENGNPPAPKKKGFWSRLTGRRDGEEEAHVSDAATAEQAPSQPVAPEPSPPFADEMLDPPAPVPEERAHGTLHHDTSTQEASMAEPVPQEQEDPEDGPAETPASEELPREKVSFWDRLTGRRHRESEFAGEASSSERGPDAHDGGEVPDEAIPAEALSDPAEPAQGEPGAATEAPDPEILEIEALGSELNEAEARDEPAPEKVGFWTRLKSGLSRTATSLTQGITDLVTKRKLDAETLEELEDLLIRADLGLSASARIIERVGKGRHDKMIAPDEVKELIADEVEDILEPVAHPLVIDRAQKPFILLMVGVNGSGKTTTIGKLASQWRSDGLNVMLAAGDTFRAAAIEQLKVWGERTGASVIARPTGADAAGVAFDAITEARGQGADVLLIDTAGRLQNRAELMAELEKVVRVIRKQDATAPHAVLLVLDATVGQNALSQVEAFQKVAGVTGLVMTKLDGTARGGILVAIAEKYGLPVHLIGVGEGADDLQPFSARDFARAIAGLQ